MSRTPSNVSRRKHKSQADKLVDSFKARLDRFRITIRGRSLSKAEAKLTETLMRREFEFAIEDIRQTSAHRE